MTSQLDANFMAFRTSSSLRNNAENFIQNIRSEVASSQADLLHQTMMEFVDHCLEVYFLKPTEVAKLQPRSLKIIELTVNTIRKAVNMAMGKIIKKLSNAQMAPISGYMDSVMFRDREDFTAPAFIAFPIPNDLKLRFRHIAHQAETGSPQSVVPDLIAAFDEIAEIALDYFFEQPVKLLNLGPILRKMADLGINTTQAATHSLLRKIFKTMNDQQLKDSIGYFESLIVEGAPHLYASSI